MYNSRAPQVFEASATIQLQADPNVLGLDRPVQVERDRMSEAVPTEVGVLESREFARLTLRTLELAAHGDKSDAAVVRHTTSRPEALPAPLPTVEEIIEGRQISSVLGHPPHQCWLSIHRSAAGGPNRECDGGAYVARNLELTSSTAGEASAWLQKQVEEQRQRVEQSEAALQQYRMQHHAEALEERGNDRQDIVAQKLTDLQVAVTKARTETIDKEAQYQQLLRLTSNPDALDTLPAIASSAFIHQLKQELADRQQQLAKASEDLGERHPDRVKLQTEVDTAEAQTADGDFHTGGVHSKRL